MNTILRPFRWVVSRPLARSLRVRLILLVLLASLPSLGLLFLTASQQRDDALATGQDEARRYARLVAADQGSVSRQIDTVLKSMAITNEIRGGDARACSALLRGLTTSTGEPLGDAGGPDFSVDGATFTQVVVLNDDLEVFCAGPAGSGLISPEDEELVNAALDRGVVTSGNHRTSASGSLVVTYVVPLSREDGAGRRVILATLDVYSLSRFAREINLPSDSFIVLFDKDGVLQQRYPAQEDLSVGDELTGTPLVDATIGNVEPDVSDPDDASLIDGEEFVFATDDFWTPGPDGSTRLFYAMVAFPEEVIVERANEKFSQNLGRLGIAALVALVAAWIGADLFVGRDGEARKGLIRDFYHAFSTGSINGLDQIIGPGYEDRTAGPGQADGIDGLRQNVAAFRTAFPNGQILIRELIGDHDKVVARVTLSGTHVADYFGVPPSGKHVVADGVETFRFMHGMVVESWSMFGDLRQRDKPVEEVSQPARDRQGILGRLFRRRPGEAASRSEP